MQWLIWGAAGFLMEVSGGTTLSHWVAEKDEGPFWGIIGILYWLIGHLIGQHYDCFGYPVC